MSQGAGDLWELYLSFVDTDVLRCWFFSALRGCQGLGAWVDVMHTLLFLPVACGGNGGSNPASLLVRLIVAVRLCVPHHTWRHVSRLATCSTSHCVCQGLEHTYPPHSAHICLVVAGKPCVLCILLTQMAFCVGSCLSVREAVICNGYISPGWHCGMRQDIIIDSPCIISRLYAAHRCSFTLL